MKTRTQTKKRPNQSSDASSKKLSKGQLWRARQNKIGSITDLKGKQGILLITNRGRENMGTAELVAFLELDEETSETSGVDDKDVQDKLQEEIEKLQEKKSYRYDVGMDCLSVLSLREDPIQVVSHLFEKVIETGKAQTTHIERLIPLQFICNPSLEAIVSCCSEHIPEFFKENQPSSFSILTKTRGSGESLDRITLINAIAELVDQKVHNVDLDEPDTIIIVEMLRSICGISFFPGGLFRKYQKLNLRTLAEKVSSPGGKTKKTDDDDA